MKAEWTEHNDEYVFLIQADRYLRNMVRALVGTCLDYAEGAIDDGEMIEIIGSGDRSRAGTSVPACGLILKQVSY
jgi:tRNA pseudouridine38-40 synthase